jgi:hypothetical protein
MLDGIRVKGSEYTAKRPPVIPPEVAKQLTEQEQEDLKRALIRGQDPESLPPAQKAAVAKAKEIFLKIIEQAGRDYATQEEQKRDVGQMSN